MIRWLVLVPGIMGSELVNGAGKTVWPPSLKEFVTHYKRIKQLMGDDVRASSIIDKVLVKPVYDSLLQDVNACGYHPASSTRRLIDFPYDWRKSNEVSAKTLADHLDSQVAKHGKPDHITILAHSMGGLVARRILEGGDYSGRTWFDRIRQLITLGTPHFGAPKAIARLSGREEVLSVRGKDVVLLASDPRYSSLYELVGPTETAFTISADHRGDLPYAVDRFNDTIINSMKLTTANVKAANAFWSKLDLARRPEWIDYFFFGGSAHTTASVCELVGKTLTPIDRENAGDGTVPISSAVVDAYPARVLTQGARPDLRGPGSAQGVVRVPRRTGRRRASGGTCRTAGRKSGHDRALRRPRDLLGRPADRDRDLVCPSGGQPEGVAGLDADRPRDERAHRASDTGRHLRARRERHALRRDDQSKARARRVPARCVTAQRRPRADDLLRAMSVDPIKVQAALYAWGLRHGILTDAAAREATAITGSPQAIPFTQEHVDFFRSRRIVRIRLDRPVPPTLITIYTRQAISARRVQQLKNAFESKFASAGIRIDVATSRPYKIDQTLQTYGEFGPVLKARRGRIACGSSVGIGNQRNAGTLTALARQEGNGETLFGLSCNHVVGGCNTALPGTPIVVPGIQDVSADYPEVTIVGTHNSAARMSQGLPTVSDITDNSDLACFELDRTGRARLSSQQGTGPDAYDTPTKFAGAIEPELAVKKWGRSTGFTTGRVATVLTEPEPVEYNVISYYGPQQSQSFKGTIYFPQVYELIGSAARPFSLGGDSGALVVTHDDSPEVVGVIIAGSPDKTLVLPLQPMLAQLKLMLASGVN